MTPLLFTIEAFGISLAAGVLGSLLGLGGGIIVIPALTLLLGIDIRYAIGASIITIIATSSGAAAAYVRERMTNLRVAMWLELGTTTGALTGAYLAGLIDSRYLYIIFALILGYSAAAMLRKRKQIAAHDITPTPVAARLRLSSSYVDEAEGREIPYTVVNARMGLGMMYIAGVVSGLLGIGSGALKVPAMDLGMRLPIKVSTATSNFMIGVTGAASAGVYFMRGDINPFIVAPVAAGVIIGATLGSRLLGKIQSSTIRVIFVVVLLWVSIQMFLKGVQQ